MVPSDSHPRQSDLGRLSRRRLLALACTAAAGGLAGCNAVTGRDDPADLHAGDWHAYGNGPENGNRVSGGAPEPTEHAPLYPADWSYAPPVVDGEIVYFAAEREAVAIGFDGRERWSRRLGGEAFGAPALDPDRGRLYVPTRGGEQGGSPSDGADAASVVALSVDGGDVIDTHRVGDGATYGVTVVDGDVYARSATACVRLGPDGTERWRVSLEPLVYDEYNLGDSTATQIPPAVADDGVYVPDRDALVRLDRESGEERWRVSVDTPYAASVVDDRGVVQTGWQETVAVDRAGEERWRRDLHSRAAAAVDGDDVYVVAGDLYELDAESGESNWHAHVPSEGTAAPVVTDDSVVVAGSGVRAFRRDAGGILSPERLRWRADSVHVTAYASPVIAAGGLLAVGPFGLQVLDTGD
ncbi:outer membrane protein assembly factor BamB family protein [Halobellus rubicundus]|uniref:PQQ-binding-like beta-propeller repeat protein n=1 Tax=Halobellus rubicundus TaxID=2996466 RepID=A0ABD5MDT0_9EURY